MINASDKWKQIILTLPDNYFFELMKNYLGKLQTPFNKHELVENLIKFLIKSDAENKLLDSLSEKEVLLLTAIKFINKPAAKSIYEFFLGVIPFIELCDILKNLEEKLIIYSDNGSIFISPLFEDKIERDIINPGLLYKSEECTPGSGKMVWLTDGLILSFLSMLVHQKDLLKSSGAFKKRAFTQIETLYPNLFKTEEGSKKLELVRKIIHNLKLFRINENSLIPRSNIWDDLSDLDKNERWLYLASAATTESNHTLSQRITTLKRVIETLPNKRSFMPENLKKLIRAISCDPNLETTDSINQFIDDLINLNILIPLENGTLVKNPTLDINNINPNYGDKHTLILQGNFDITYKPWITFKDGYSIAIFSALKKMDIYTELIITKDSVIKGLTLLPLETLIKDIERISGNPIPDNIFLSLKEWEKESKKAQHYNCSVLLLESDKEFILKETGVIDHLIMLNPTPGVYLIKSEDFKNAKALLENVDIIPVDKTHTEPLEEFELPDYNKKNPLNIQWEEKEREYKQIDSTILLKKASGISASKEEIDDLKKRIDRGIIFTEEQIRKGISKTDFSEAKGINYQAKLRLIEVSLKSSNNKLEINSVDDDFTIKKELVLPMKIEKNGDTKTLIGIKLPQEEHYSIDISKISLVKRIHTTLF